MKKETLGGLVDQLYEAREKRMALEKQVKAMEHEEDELRKKIFDRADDEETAGGKGKLASFSINERVSPQVSNWDEFYKYIHENKFFHLLHRRPSSDGCREIFDRGEQIPGVDKFTQRVINLQKAK